MAVAEDVAGEEVSWPLGRSLFLHWGLAVLSSSSSSSSSSRLWGCMAAVLLLSIGAQAQLLIWAGSSCT